MSHGEKQAGTIAIVTGGAFDFQRREVGSDTWIRTTDPLINSQLLYR